MVGVSSVLAFFFPAGDRFGINAGGRSRVEFSVWWSLSTKFEFVRSNFCCLLALVHKNTLK